MTFRTPTDGYAFPDAFMRPPVMAIGDSIYNGMRSATINAEFAAKAPPAAVSRVIDPHYAFRAPRYPEVLLLDFEQAFREVDLGDLIERLRKRIRDVVANGRRWGRGDHVVQAEHCAWDNLSQAGALVEDLIERDWAYWDGLVRTNLPKLKEIDRIGDLLASGFDAIDYHMGLNGRFLINPNHRPELSAMRPIDLVALRRPRHLLVNVGANHGIIDITLRGTEADPEATTEDGLRTLAKWPDAMVALAELLTALPAEVETIHVNTVPLPSSVPNMMPPYNPRDIQHGQLPRDGGYFPVYDNRLGGPGDYTHYSARRMKELDGEVRAINERMIQKVQAVFDARGDDRIGFFRLDKALKRHDGKHEAARAIVDGNPGVRLEFAERTYSNKAIDFDNFLVFDLFREGGLGSLDNHHPSGLGYAVLTRELLREMRRKIPDIKLNRAPISEQGDRLFSDPPGDYASFVRVLYRLRRRRAGLPAEPSLDEARGADLPPPPPAPVPLALDKEEEDAEAVGEIVGKLLRSRAP